MKLKQKPLMKIEPKKKEITIHNMRIEKPHQLWDVRCDRVSPLGSPFFLKGDESRRDLVCDSYQDWFDNEVLNKNNWEAYEELLKLRDLYRRHGKLRIYCWCAPKRCHTKTIAKWLMENS